MISTSKHTITLILASTLVALSRAVRPVQAQIENPAVSRDFGQYAQRGHFLEERFARTFILFWNVTITVGTLVALGMMLWGALDWITAGGESGKIEKARGKITQSIIGLTILVFMFAIISVINQVVFQGAYDILNFTIVTPLRVP